MIGTVNGKPRGSCLGPGAQNTTSPSQFEFVIPRLLSKTEQCTSVVLVTFLNQTLPGALTRKSLLETNGIMISADSFTRGCRMCVPANSLRGWRSPVGRRLVVGSFPAI